MELSTTLAVLVTLGLGLLLVLLRLDAERFGAAEYDEARDGHWPSLQRRLSWYALGIGIIVAASVVYPREASHGLFLGIGDRPNSLLGGLLYAAIGTGQVIAFALYRYKHIRLPDVRAYPGALINAVATSFIDEAAFRGILLAYLVGAGLPALPAIAVQALAYALATRLAAPGRDRYMLAVVLSIGFASGGLTVAVGGIGGAFLGHAITRCAIFLATGHAGQVAPRGREPEDIDRKRRTPEGWRAVGARDQGSGDG